MHSVIGYIDGFNLYFGLRAKDWRRYYWLNPQSLLGNLIKPQQKLVHTKYFTARVTDSPKDPNQHKRQGTYIEAIETLKDTTIYFGHFLPKSQKCFSCKAEWNGHEEKMTDVNIAVQMLEDTYEGRFETALVISGDSDLVAPITAIRSRFPDKRIVVCSPPARHSNMLEKVVNACVKIGRKTISDSQFPDEVSKPNGYVLRRPPQWV